MVKVVAVFGISGVGKSWLISRFSETVMIQHIQASQLIRDARVEMIGRVESSEDLRRGAILNNQAILIGAFSRLQSTATKPIVFDGHSVIDAGDRLVEIPVDVIRALAPAGLIFIRDEPGSIVMRRTNDITRERPVRPEKEIENHQDRAMAMCRQYAADLNISLKVIRAGDETGFSKAVTSFLDPE